MRVPRTARRLLTALDQEDLVNRDQETKGANQQPVKEGGVQRHIGQGPLQLLMLRWRGERLQEGGHAAEVLLPLGGHVARCPPKVLVAGQAGIRKVRKGEVGAVHGVPGGRRCRGGRGGGGRR